MFGATGGDEEDGVSAESLLGLPGEGRGGGVTQVFEAEGVEGGFEVGAVEAEVFDSGFGAVKRAVFGVEVGDGEPAAGLDRKSVV